MAHLHPDRFSSPRPAESRPRAAGPASRSGRAARSGACARALALALAAAGPMLASCAGGSGSAGQRRDASVDMAAEDLTLAGEAAAARGDLEAALQQFARAIEVNPRFTRAHLGMADLYRVEGDYQKAERSYGTAAALEPTSFDAQFGHGLMLHVLDRLAEAVGAYLRALRVRPNDFRANLNLSTAYYQLGESAQALPFAEGAVRLRPEDGAARLNLGVVLASLGRDTEAVAEYQQAAELMELTPALLTNLADSLGRLKRYDEMRNALDELVKSAPSPAAHERLGFACFKLRDYPAAMANFREALRLDPDYFPALNGVGVCELNTWLWSDRKDDAARQRAVDALRRSLQISRNQPQIEEMLTRYR